MTTIFFPSCKNKAAYPEACERLLAYLKAEEQFDALAGCCREDRVLLGPDDTALCICNACMAFCEESSDAGTLISVWEVIDADPGFDFPDHSGESYVLQDCWRAQGRQEVYEAVRSILDKMNIEIIEQGNNREKSRFCGFSTLMPQNPQNVVLAPRRFGTEAESVFKELSKEDQKASMQAHRTSLPEAKVVSYCWACDAGFKLVDDEAAALINLIFDI